MLVGAGATKLWSVKNLRAAKDKLHAFRKENRPIILQGYSAPYRGQASQWLLKQVEDCYKRKKAKKAKR